MAKAQTTSGGTVMDDRLIVPSFSEVELKARSFASNVRVNPELALANVDVSQSVDYIMDSLIWQLKAHVYGRTLNERTVIHPVDWWSAFKERWFPAWLKRRFPPLYRHTTVEIVMLYPTLNGNGFDVRVPFADRSERVGALSEGE
jgi:hypothetical protein